MNQPTDIKRDKLDLIGIFGSLACTAHCLLVPVIVLFAPSLSYFLENEWIHKALVLLLAPISLLALVNGMRRHQKMQPLTIGLLGILFLFLAVGSEAFGWHKVETPLTLVGSFLLIIAHFLNLKAQKKA